MGLLLICPHCQAKIPLASRTCPACGADLRDLPPEDRRYFIGGPAVPEAATPAPETVSDPSGGSGSGIAGVVPGNHDAGKRQLGE